MEPDIVPPIDAVEDLYSTIFESRSPPFAQDVEPQFVKPPSFSSYTPITAGEIAGAVRTWSNSAPGPDGITVSQVWRCSMALLEVLFNVLLYRRFTPSTWKQPRTILIPKDDNRADPTNWRPITIGSAVQRLLHRILARRLVLSLDLHPLQRGFVHTDGTLANILLLEHYIKSRRLGRKAFNVTSLDVKKALIPCHTMPFTVRSTGWGWILPSSATLSRLSLVPLPQYRWDATLHVRSPF